MRYDTDQPAPLEVRGGDVKCEDIRCGHPALLGSRWCAHHMAEQLCDYVRRADLGFIEATENVEAFLVNGWRGLLREDVVTRLGVRCAGCSEPLPLTVDTDAHCADCRREVLLDRAGS